MDTIYLIVGESGAYSDWQQWPVYAYVDEAKAYAHAGAANAWSVATQAEYAEAQRSPNQQRVREHRRRQAKADPLGIARQRHRPKGSS